jgi:ribosome-associated translation inhibitor RaiA
MQLDIHARGFILTPALRTAVEQQALHFMNLFPHRSPGLSVRLYDVNGLRGGDDKGCLVQAKLGMRRTAIIASDINADLYRAIAGAFARLARGTRATLERARAARRRPGIHRDRNATHDGALAGHKRMRPDHE